MAPVVQPGIYAVFHSMASWLDSLSSVAVFPNPARLKTNARIAFRGKSLLELWIYSISGALVAHDVYGQNRQPSAVGETVDGFDWRLRSTSGTAVSPGIYYAWISFKDPITKGTKKQTQKMFVIP